MPKDRIRDKIKNLKFIKIVTGFELRTLAVNNNYAFMGDKAKKEYIDQYKTELKPGVSYDIPIGFTIPEKVSGIRPSGKSV